MYEPHPSLRLTELFRARPWQGADPMRCEFLFVGLDANYAPDIEQSEIFPALLDYHDDGVGFWQRRGVHHPFLLPGYRGDGRRYHRNFARLGFTAADAARVSFIELLHVPTVGRNRLDASDLSSEHLALLDQAIRQGEARHVFVSDGVLRLMRQSRVFDWLPKSAPVVEGLRRLWSRDGRSLYQHLHFSNYGKFESRMLDEARAVFALASTTT